MYNIVLVGREPARPGRTADVRPRPKAPVALMGCLPYALVERRPLTLRVMYKIVLVPIGVGRVARQTACIQPVDAHVW
jgi:hypothetical protein